MFLLVFLSLVVTAAELAFSAELLEDLEVLRTSVVANQENISGNGVTFLDDELGKDWVS
jgi:hypothetical protein